MYIGVDIGGSKILVVAGNGDYKIARQSKIPTPSEGDQGMIETIHLIEQVAAGDPIKAIGVASPAVDASNGEILGTNPNMHGWRGTNILTLLRNHFRVPISVVGDAAAAALTEAKMGAGRGKPYVLYITISTGIGGALVINDELYHGAYDLEPGHMVLDPDGPLCGCGGRGHFEAMCSGRAIKRIYGKYGYEITDPKVWDKISATMALGFHNLISVYAPSIVVIGGGVAVHYDQFHDFLIQHLQALTPMYPLPPIVPAEHIETAVAYGALIVADQAFHTKR